MWRASKVYLPVLKFILKLVPVSKVHLLQAGAGVARVVPKLLLKFLPKVPKLMVKLVQIVTG